MTDLIEVSAANLCGEALGWAVGKAEGLDVYLEPPGYNGVPWRVFARYRATVTERAERFNPWEDWAVGGPLIDKHHIQTSFNGCGFSRSPTGEFWCAYVCKATGQEVLPSGDGPNALTAACRAIAQAKLGDTVQVPKELCQ
ncbi:phage protein NinX family protein [Pseudomonas sp. NBRC 111132]|uniref:phage protein NinX family protein n=1 Tax=Pseudomonas sp. NBRC 111132 TaxID=1661047 RepID=UPI000760D824|nr:phage protein NinX family protein [Pseudomonas sp. NBRC 111132]